MAKKPRVIKRTLDFELLTPDKIRINDTKYRYERLPPTPNILGAVRLFKDEREDDPNKTITLISAGNYDCTCADFIYRGAGDGRECKHIIAVRELGIMFQIEDGNDIPEWMED